MENKSLISIVNETNQIEQMLIEAGGEITEAIEQALAVRDLAMTEKVDGYSHIMDRFAALETHYKEKAEFFSRISKQCSNVQDRLKGNIKFAMQEMGTSELVGVDIKFKLSATKGSLVIDDEEMIPVEYKVETVVTSIDKKRLKDDLEGKEIPGARIQPGASLRAYPNTPDKKSKKVASNE